MQNQTSIRISTELLNTLKNFKEEKESYEEIIWDFIEPHLELSDQAKQDIESSVSEYKRGEFVSLDEVKRDLGL